MVSQSCSGVHLAQALVALDLQALLAELVDAFGQVLDALELDGFGVAVGLQRVGGRGPATRQLGVDGDRSVNSGESMNSKSMVVFLRTPPACARGLDLEAAVFGVGRHLQHGVGQLGGVAVEVLLQAGQRLGHHHLVAQVGLGQPGRLDDGVDDAGVALAVDDLEQALVAAGLAATAGAACRR